MADFTQPLGQHMLQKATDELLGVQRAGLALPASGIRVTEGHPVIVQVQDAPVTDRDPEDVGRQILQSRGTVADRLADVSS